MSRIITRSLIAVAMLFILHGQAWAEEERAEKVMVGQLLDYCLPSLVSGQPVHELVKLSPNGKRLLRLKERSSEAFLNGQAGDAWLVGGGPEVVLAALQDVAVCQVFAREVEPEALMQQLDSWFDSQESPLKRAEPDQSEPMILNREYCGPFGSVSVVIQASAIKESGHDVQGLITSGRVANCE
ncbi:NMCC_0638 family (lipo)protein [Aestuariispira insulae]|uniref:Uncharacterized protein n=1 Tax=Aestuariispira insulae TaxID=1461337 RepID=A0A3D9HWS1_9PROT|nr:hypothetical protein [Aestuariispira insulae]RED53831.1 hypothetical protein DFP90_101630 [Aestuariispira insulae]